MWSTQFDISVCQSFATELALWAKQGLIMRHYVQFYGCRKTNIESTEGQSKLDNPEKLVIWAHKTTNKKERKKRLFLVTYQEGNNHICQSNCLKKSICYIQKKATMLFPELII